MKFTPLDITHQTFATRLSGYDKQAVQRFLEELGTAVENLLRERQEQQQQITALTQELDRRRAEEDEIRRVIVASERIAHDLKENAVREADLLITGARQQIQEMQLAQEARAGEFEAEQQKRVSELEIAFRNRFADLEREQYNLTLSREHKHAERVRELDNQFNNRYLELQSRITAARQEYTQFLNAYRALVSSFADLSQRHSLPEETPLPLPEPAQEIPTENANQSFL